MSDGIPIKYGTVDHSKSKKNTALRIKDMFIDITTIVDEHPLDIFVVEGVQAQSNNKTMLMLSQLQGMLIGYAYLRNIPVASYLPTEWRKILEFKQGAGVKRPELKQQSVEYVHDQFGIVATEDVCESICIAMAAYKSLKK